MTTRNEVRKKRKPSKPPGKPPAKGKSTLPARRRKAKVGPLLFSLFEHPHFGGKEWQFRDTMAVQYVGNAINDKASSIKVFKHVWRFWEHANFKGLNITLGPGEYPRIEDQGLPDDCISSYMQV